MKQIISYLSIVLFFSACSGTSEPQASTLLIIGFDNKVGLLDTCLLTNDIASDCPSSTLATEENPRPFLLEHNLPEASESLGFDIADRDNRRDELVVLSAKGLGSERKAYLSFFTIANISPDPQSAQLNESRSFITLEIENIAIDNDVSPQPASFCPTDVQFEEEGQYVAFFSDQDVCNASLVNAIDIIDLQTSPPTLVKHIELGNSIPKGFYIDQVDDKLYYLQESGSKLALTSLLLDDDIVDNEEQEVVNFDNDETVIDMLSLSNELVILNEEDFIVIDNFRGEATVNATIETPFNINRQIINDDFSETQHLYLLSNDRFAPYPSLKSTEEPESRSISAISGTYESVNTFIYLLGNQQVHKFDAFTIDFEVTPRLTSFTISSLNNAKFITWIQATVL